MRQITVPIWMVFFYMLQGAFGALYLAENGIGHFGSRLAGLAFFGGSLWYLAYARRRFDPPAAPHKAVVAFVIFGAAAGIVLAVLWNSGLAHQTAWWLVATAVVVGGLWSLRRLASPR